MSMIGAVLAVAVAVTPPLEREPIFLHCAGGVLGTGKTAAEHDVVIDGGRGWIDGRRYNADLWEGRAYYRLRGPVTAPDATPAPQITFFINRRTGSYGASTSHEVVESTLTTDFMPNVGCAVSKPKF